MKRFTYGFAQIERLASAWVAEFPPDVVEPPIPSKSRRQYLEAPPYNGDGSDDAGSRQGALQDMDLHCFHPVFFTTPRGRYVIPQHVGNLGDAQRTSIEARR